MVTSLTLETNTRVTVRKGISGRASTPSGPASRVTTGTSVTTTLGSRSRLFFKRINIRLRST